MNQNFYDKLNNVIAKDSILLDEPMSRHTTFRVGGPADFFVTPKAKEEVRDVIRICKEAGMPYYIIGNGSNILVKDQGYKGAIIEVNNRINSVDVIGDEIVADAGAKLSSVAMVAYENDLAGFEFGHSIPGNVGGAVVMNAGAYGGEIKDVIKWAKVLTEDGEVVTLNAEELELGYRTSIVQKKNMIVLQMCIKLDLGSQEEIALIMQMFMQKRRAKQPLEYPSAGSTFKRPEGYFAGKLIEDAGLRGYQVGGAMVSEKHCGFVINYDNATATDILRLMDDVKATVKEQFDVELEPEVKII